jgi:hypothetical protein
MYIYHLVGLSTVKKMQTAEEDYSMMEESSKQREAALNAAETSVRFILPNTIGVEKRHRLLAENRCKVETTVSLGVDTITISSLDNEKHNYTFARGDDWDPILDELLVYFPAQ